MEPLKHELKTILDRVKRLETRVATDDCLCSVVRDASLRIALMLRKQPQLRML